MQKSPMLCFRRTSAREADSEDYALFRLGIQNYYQIATNVNIDCAVLNWEVSKVFTSRLRSRGNRLAKGVKSTRWKVMPHSIAKTGRELTKVERERYGKSKMLRWMRGSGEPIYPIGYVKHRNPMAKKWSICCYTAEGRQGLHDNLRINTGLMLSLMFQPLQGRSAEYADNRISLFSAQWGKCAITGKEFQVTSDIHCHHIKRKADGGGDEYGNLILVLAPVHRLIHATDEDTINQYLKLLKLEKDQLQKLNVLREKVGHPKIA